MCLAPSVWIVPYFVIDELSSLARTLNLFRLNILRWSGDCQGSVKQDSCWRQHGASGEETSE
jgi:hypothetical protein